MRFRGCIYADPPRKRQGVSDITEITMEELQELDLVGLPVCVEHGGPQRGVVESQNTDPVSGYTTVDYRLFDDVAGETLAALTRTGRLRDLSLCHNIYPDDSKPMIEWEKEPVEVSLCMRGGRPGTHIFRVEMSGVRRRNRCRSGSINTSRSQADVPTDRMANVDTSNTLASAAADGVPATPGEGAQPHLSQAASQQLRQAAPNAVADTQADAPSQVSADSEEFLKCAMKLTENDQAVVLNKFQNLYGDLVDLKRKNANLERKFTEEETKKKSEATRMAQDIVKVIDGIYSEYLGTDMTDDERARFSDDLAQNSTCLQGLQGMRQATVAMSAQRKLSAIRAETQTAEHERQSAALTQVRKRMSDYEMELAALDRGGASPVMDMHQHHAPPAAVQVAASNRTMGQRGADGQPPDNAQSRLPAALRATLQAYDANGATGTGRVYATDFVNSDVIAGGGPTKRSRVV
ncbi:hypothetical protein CYMTET_9317 [Cymbomonas tetramitiformis]|uniref:Uncharacterized protein n=1 Tax=Cymbomonas tetramitiformis TaxID=36881 RepID=A0AAE0GRX4_9CHLO|nr:hypothetical protein CYMTET_9317 [Cymbomonas tetramitiformis]